MHRMWFGYEHRIHPTALKRMIAKFADQFQGFRQHDAQELLMFLLDGLHEDLNLVVDKKYVELEVRGSCQGCNRRYRIVFH